MSAASSNLSIFPSETPMYFPSVSPSQLRVQCVDTPKLPRTRDRSPQRYCPAPVRQRSPARTAAPAKRRHMTQAEFKAIGDAHVKTVLDARALKYTKYLIELYDHVRAHPTIPMEVTDSEYKRHVSNSLNLRPDAPCGISAPRRTAILSNVREGAKLPSDYTDQERCYAIFVSLRRRSGSCEYKHPDFTG